MEMNYSMLADIYNTLSSDESLLRLLHYPPEDLFNTQPDPLSEDLPNITEMDEETKWNIIKKSIKKTKVTSDLTTPQCRLMFYMGRRAADVNNDKYSTKQIIFDVIAHSDYENEDFRTMRITDRICQLLLHQNVAGINKTKDAGGGQIANLPSEFVGYSNVFQFGSGQ
ncbi:hypothetical protein SAMN05421503_1428 [Terribacillus aidingensis]|uniref:Uncharacterized protein n=1 Tax=Terribacillus aidingensis TaxID=586416 RepID=A0A285NKE7_9BACI|nr:hypothetical protein [Terribacillus aidingensis]SNZ09939.1 hypothetical protein SAMN05421503_1428 [Terribacillus aidingensis]